MGYNGDQLEEDRMALSKRARRMLDHGTRSSAHGMERSSIVAALAEAGLPVCEPVVAFQQKFGGLSYRVQGSSHGMTWGLFRPEAHGFSPDGQQYYFQCGAHRVAQFGFYLDQKGILYVDERFAAPLPIASSVEMYIESDAIVNELIDLGFTCWLPMETRARGAPAMQSRWNDPSLPLIREASDQYTSWWGHDRLRIVQQVFWGDGPALNTFALYARSPAEAKPLVAVLHDLFPGLSSSDKLLPWPTSGT